MGRGVRRNNQLPRLPQFPASGLFAGHEVLVAPVRDSNRHPLRLHSHRQREISRHAPQSQRVDVRASARRRVSRVVRLPPPRRLCGTACQRQHLQGSVPHTAHARPGIETLRRDTRHVNVATPPCPGDTQYRFILPATTTTSPSLREPPGILP